MICLDKALRLVSIYIVTLRLAVSGDGQNQAQDPHLDLTLAVRFPAQPGVKYSHSAIRQSEIVSQFAIIKLSLQLSPCPQASGHHSGGGSGGRPTSACSLLTSSFLRSTQNGCVANLASGLGLVRGALQSSPRFAILGSLRIWKSTYRIGTPTCELVYQPQLDLPSRFWFVETLPRGWQRVVRSSPAEHHQRPEGYRREQSGPSKPNSLFTINQLFYTQDYSLTKPNQHPFLSRPSTPPRMQHQLLLTGPAALVMGISPALALPEPVAIPELLVDRGICIGGKNLVGSGCGPNQNGKTSCSANDRAVVSQLFLFAPSPVTGPA